MNQDSIRRILCYGDSNTWGAIPGSDHRYAKDIRWTAVLQSLLGEMYEVVSEGLCGRVLKSNVASFEKNGINYILPAVLSAEPLEWVIIMLGTNDVKDKYGLSSGEIANNLRETVSIIKNAKIENKENLKILIICPPNIIENEQILANGFKDGINKIKELPVLYKKVAEETNSLFLNAGDYISSSVIDCIHLDEDSHLKLAEVIKNFILQ